MEMQIIEAGSATPQNIMMSRLYSRTSKRPPTRLARVLRALLEKHGLSEKRLAREAGVEQATLNRILTGVTQHPRSHTLEKLAEYFGVESMQLLQEGKIATVRLKSIPVYDLDQLATGGDMPRERIKTVAIQAEGVSDSAFGVLASSPAMESRIPHGAVVIFDPEAQPQPGDVVLARNAREGYAVIRRLDVEGGIRYLTANNSRYQTINITADHELLAVGRKLLIDL